MEIGICVSIEGASSLPGVFDFIEVNVQSVLAPETEDGAFAPTLDVVARSPKPIKAANSFLPGDLKCIGPEVDSARLLQYAETAFKRAQKIGIDTIVFGSGVARKIPEGTSAEEAMKQFSELLALLGPIAQRYGVTLVVEPLNRGECNLINSLAGGAEAVKKANHPNIRLLADIYHMRMENEPETEITKYGELLHHVHVAELAGRKFPGKAKEDFRPFYRALKQAGYKGRISLECGWDAIATDLEGSIKFFRDELAAAGIA